MSRAPAIALLSLLAAAPMVHAHDWYSGLTSPAGGSCCSDRDCRPVSMCAQRDGKEGLEIEGACRPVPWDKVLGLSSPDGKAHACWTPSMPPATAPLVLCVVLPGAA